MNDLSFAHGGSRVLAVLGPTNTGKTHLAVERMLAHASGMIGLPLRLLAREIYDRIVLARGKRAVALITGEEKIVPPQAAYWVCTVEAMPLERRVELLAIDEVQLCADPDRGHVFTHRLLHARGASETLLLGAATAAPLIRRLIPGVEIQSRERFSQLIYDGPKKLTRLPRRSAVVAFSADQVYGIAELIRRQRGGAAVVMGSLSPRTRNAQVELFQSGEVDFLVATDAIGMGLNMDVDHVAFAGLRKFDGHKSRWLQSQEIGQIAGRAGRFRKDGTFGVTGEAPDLDPDVVSAVENHTFEPLVAAEWRNAKLDFTSLTSLMASLLAPPPHGSLRLCKEAQDETSLRQLARDELVARRCRDRTNLMRLWEVCQTPDFRKVTQDEHTRLLGQIFENLTQGRRKVPQEWMQSQYAAVDHVDGEIDTISARLAKVRTLAYVAHRADWIENAESWQARARELEVRLSDTLHEKLTQRFVDRRTSILLKTLNDRPGELLSQIEADGAVRVEGHLVGILNGLDFAPEVGVTDLETRTLRNVVNRTVAPEILRRLNELASAAHEAFALDWDGLVRWRGYPVAEIVSGGPFRPRARMLGDIGADATRSRAARRIEVFVANEARRVLFPLGRLGAEMENNHLVGAARGIAYQLVENFGVIDRSEAIEQIHALSREDRVQLQSLGLQFGAFSLYLRKLWQPEARVFAEIFATLSAPSWRPSLYGLTALPLPRPPREALLLRGLREVAGFAAPVLALEKLGALSRAAEAVDGSFEVSAEMVADLGWTLPQTEAILRGLGYSRVQNATLNPSNFWRGRKAAEGRKTEPRSRRRRRKRSGDAAPRATTPP